MLEIIKHGISTNWSFNYGVPYAESDLLGRLYDKNKKNGDVLSFHQKEMGLPQSCSEQTNFPKLLERLNLLGIIRTPFLKK